MHNCTCDTCRMLNHLRSKDVDAEVIDTLLHNSFDQEYYKAIFDGSWPNAIEILETTLDRLKKEKGNA